MRGRERRSRRVGHVHCCEARPSARAPAPKRALDLRVAELSRVVSGDRCHRSGSEWTITSRVVSRVDCRVSCRVSVCMEFGTNANVERIAGSSSAGAGGSGIETLKIAQPKPEHRSTPQMPERRTQGRQGRQARRATTDVTDERVRNYAGKRQTEGRVCHKCAPARCELASHPAATPHPMTREAESRRSLARWFC